MHCSYCDQPIRDGEAARYYWSWDESGTGDAWRVRDVIHVACWERYRTSPSFIADTTDWEAEPGIDPYDARLAHKRTECEACLQRRADEEG